MFWKVELHKDGSIRTVEPCTEKAENGGHIIYVEAPDKAEACTEAVKWYRAWFSHVCCLECNERRADYPAIDLGWNRSLRVCNACRPVVVARINKRRDEERAASVAERARDDEQMRQIVEEIQERHGLIPKRSPTPALVTPKTTVSTAPCSRPREPKAPSVAKLSDSQLRALIRFYDSVGGDGFRAWLASELSSRRVIGSGGREAAE